MSSSAQLQGLTTTHTLQPEQHLRPWNGLPLPHPALGQRNLPKLPAVSLTTPAPFILGPDPTCPPPLLPPLSSAGPSEQSKGEVGRCWVDSRTMARPGSGRHKCRLALFSNECLYCLYRTNTGNKASGEWRELSDKPHTHRKEKGSPRPKPPLSPTCLSENCLVWEVGQGDQTHKK